MTFVSWIRPQYLHDLSMVTSLNPAKGLSALPLNLYPGLQLPAQEGKKNARPRRSRVPHLTLNYTVIVTFNDNILVLQSECQQRPLMQAERLAQAVIQLACHGLEALAVRIP